MWFWNIHYIKFLHRRNGPQQIVRGGDWENLDTRYQQTNCYTFVTCSWKLHNYTLQLFLSHFWLLRQLVIFWVPFCSKVVLNMPLRSKKLDSQGNTPPNLFTNVINLLDRSQTSVCWMRRLDSWKWIALEWWSNAKQDLKISPTKLQSKVSQGILSVPEIAGYDWVPARICHFFQNNFLCNTNIQWNKTRLPLFSVPNFPNYF